MKKILIKYDWVFFINNILQVVMKMQIDQQQKCKRKLLLHEDILVNIIKDKIHITSNITEKIRQVGVLWIINRVWESYKVCCCAVNSFVPTSFVNSRTLVRFIEMCLLSGCTIKRNVMRRLCYRDMLGLVTHGVLL